MENIVKIILNKENETVKSMIIVRENSVEVIDDKNKFKQIEKDLITEMQENNPAYENLEPRKVVAKMLEDGILAENTKIYIKKIELENDGFRIFLSNNTERKIETIDEQYDAKLEKAFDELRDFYGDVDLLDLGLVEDMRVKESKLKGIRNIKITKRFIALAVAGAMALMGGSYYLGNKNAKDNNVKEDTKIEFEINTQTPIVTPAPTSAPTAVPTNVPTATPTPIITSTPTDIPTEAPTLSSTFNQPNVSFTTLEEDSNSNIVTIEIHDGYVTPREYDSTDSYFEINNLVQTRFANTSDLASHLNNPNANPDLLTTGTFIFYEKYFQAEADRAYVEYFSNLGNEIIYHAFYNNNMDNAREYIQVANYEIVRCIRDLNPLKVNINGEEKYITYDDLSHNAKQLVLNIAYANSYLLTTDNFEYAGEIINAEDTQNIIIDANEALEKTK